MSACPRGGRSGPKPKPYFCDFIEGRRGEILDAALAVFGERGYEAGTMREIAGRIGVSEPALYRHYESKEAILSDIVATAGDRIAGAMVDTVHKIDGTNVTPMLHLLIETRRSGFRGSDGLSRDVEQGVPSALKGGAGNVIHVLFHAAPHNEAFIKLLRAHLGQPIVMAMRDLIPRVDAHFGIERSPAELESRLRIFMSLFAGYFTTSMLYDASPDDDAVVGAMLAIMGWE